MGMDLRSETGDDYRFGGIAWVKVLTLAETYGWQPAGTLAYIPTDKTDTADVEETYLVNNGRIVTAEDAANLAEALEKALDDIPDPDEYPAPTLPPDDARQHLRELGMLGDLSKIRLITPDEGGASDPVSIFASFAGGGVLLTPDDRLTPLEFFAGEDKGKVVGFIEFCRLGAFQIW